MMQNYPQLNPIPSLQASPERLQHITELTSQLPSIRILNRDQSLFETTLRLRDGRTTALRVNLPPSFPQERPVLAVTHPVRHPWVDAAGRLSFPALEQWSSPHSRLASVVHEAYGTLSSNSTPPGAPGPSAGPAPSASPAGAVKVAGVPREFPELEKLSDEELQRALLDEQAYARLLTTVVENSNVAQVKNQLKKRNYDLAKSILQKEGAYNEVKNQLAIIRSSEFASVKEAYDDRIRRQAAVVERLAPRLLIERLSASAAAADTESERLCDAFMAGELGLDQFCEEYVKLRGSYHRQELKAQAAAQTLV